MENWIINNYLFLKSIHIISIIAWMAGLLYLPRLFVYHTTTKNNSESYKMLLIMELRLMKYIMLPAMILSLLSGISLILSLDFKHSVWLHIKISLVLILIFYHHYLKYCYNKFLKNNNIHSQKFYKIINEIPTVLMIFIVFLVTFKPYF